MKSICLYIICLSLLLLCGCEPDEYLDTNPHDVGINTEVSIDGIYLVVDISGSNIDSRLIDECGIYWMGNEYLYKLDLDDINMANQIIADGGKLNYVFRFAPWDKQLPENYYRRQTGVILLPYFKLNAGRRDSIFGSQWKTENIMIPPVIVGKWGSKTEFIDNDLSITFNIDTSEDIKIDACGVYWGIEKVEPEDIESMYSKVTGRMEHGKFQATIKDAVKNKYTHFLAYARVGNVHFYSNIDSIRAPGSK